MSNTLTGLHNGAATGAGSALKSHASKAQDAIGQISTGKKNVKASSNAAERAIASNVTVQKNTLSIANDGTVKASAVLQVASSLIDSDMRILQEMKALSTMSSGGDLDPDKRALLDKQFQNLKNQIQSNQAQIRWGSSPLLSGSGGAMTVATNAAAAAAVGLTAVATAFAGTLNAGSQGFLLGTVESAVVLANGGGYDISVVVDGQTFKANAEVPAAGGVLDLISTSDNANVIRLDYAAGIAGITNVATFQTAVNDLLGLGAGAAHAQFTPESTAAVGQNGVTAVAIGGNTSAGTYALSYAANSGELKLTNGTQTFTASIAATGAAQTVQFSNGVSVSVGAGFAAGTAIDQAVFSVSTGTGTSLSIQTGDRSTDTLTFNLPIATTGALGIGSIDVLTPANAATAGLAIDNALKTLQEGSADIGAFIKRLETVSDVLGATIENLDAALMVYDDVDMPDAMARLLQSTAMEKASYRAISDALSRLSDQTSFIQNAR